MLVTQLEPARTSVAQTSHRLDFVDALRGFACLWVLIHHSFESLSLAQISSHPLLAGAAGFAQLGWLGVSLFLVLSGFCLYYPLVRRSAPAAIELNLREFARRRALRILPPYFAVVALFTGVAWFAQARSIPWPEVVGWKDVVLHSLMLHNLRPSTFASINPALWSLALEVQLYAVFPIFVWIAARRGLRTLAFLTFGSAVLWQFAAYARYGFSLQWQPDMAVAYHALPARWFEFSAGMAAAALVARPIPGQRKVAAIAAGLLIIPAIWFVSAISRFGPVCDPVWGIIFASALVLLANVPGASFSHPALRWVVLLGATSYSVYLVHHPLLLFLTPEHFGMSATGPLSVTSFLAARLAIVIAIGVGFFILLERPFIATAARPRPMRVPQPG